MKNPNLNHTPTRVIAFDKRAHCTRLVEAGHTHLEDDEGRAVVRWTDFYPELGFYTTVEDGKVVKVFGKFTVVLNEGIAEFLEKNYG